ncbi:unnamed protein product (macronuclear) [Paramecium tetraurelia]|uniref:Transmembrane protein n=1 Tax=Paramecium tetraurelia TaxID=5888 RepID=A0CLQ9_PARTE|nr:uncharacterized protein GSPATT00038651001 [Paramecium tetraurelia]CAK71726.1 unnamed protein product [Paramecium tetraurelia]|eukprot:XP_001439123.1 hypothetical protein (macronuclear) [Paramecium tetraurelia strain d4-2]
MIFLIQTSTSQLISLPITIPSLIAYFICLFISYIIFYLLFCSSFVFNRQFHRLFYPLFHRIFHPKIHRIITPLFHFRYIVNFIPYIRVHQWPISFFIFHHLFHLVPSPISSKISLQLKQGVPQIFIFLQPQQYYRRIREEAKCKPLIKPIRNPFLIDIAFQSISIFIKSLHQNNFFIQLFFSQCSLRIWNPIFILLKSSFQKLLQSNS